ncbi:MAG: hypothetical protein U1D67_00350, partial [Dehalococcoidia bacterium]|nr:hypothetical protein [Dehalococcoidia bacterium]
AKLYSVEFYSLVKHAVSDAGYVAADLPAGEGLLWDEYYSTLRAAGFEFIKPFDSILEADNPGVSELKKQFLSRAAAQKTNPQGYPVTTRDPEFLEQAFAKLIRDNLRELQHRFIFLQSKKQPVNTRFRDDGIVLYALNATRFKLASEVKFDATFKPGRINSIFRPTMPLQSFFDLNFPY